MPPGLCRAECQDEIMFGRAQRDGDGAGFASETSAWFVILSAKNCVIRGGVCSRFILVVAVRRKS